MTEREINEQQINTIRDNLKDLADTYQCVSSIGCFKYAQTGRRCGLEGCQEMKRAERNYFPIDYNSGTSEITEDDLWSCDNSLREGITEAAYCDRVFELMRHIKHGNKVTDSHYIELAKLVFDDVDNYLFKVSEG